jgi:hypothetical protein
MAYSTDGTSSGNTSTGSTDIVVAKFDVSGNVLWLHQQTTFNTTLGDTIPSIAVDSSGCYVAYQTTGTASGQTNINGTDIVVFRLDNAGSFVWTRQQPTFNTTADDTVPSIAADSSGCYVAYQTTGTVSGQTKLGTVTDIVVFRLDSLGNFLWARQQNTFNTTGSDSIPKIAADSEGCYVAYQTGGTVSGQTKTGVTDIVVFRLNNEGGFAWANQNNQFNSTRNRYPSIGSDARGCYLVFLSEI